MGAIVDAAYLTGLAVASPVLLPRMVARGKHRIDWAARLGKGPDLPAARAPRVLLHAVSLGEVNALRPLVDRLQASTRPVEVVVASTTQTGLNRARTLFSDRCRVLQYPLDLSWAVDRFLNRIQPDLFASVELEVWPNFTRACKDRLIPQYVINGRLSERSFRGYRRIRPLVRRMFQRIDCVGVQDETYARRFTELGADRVVVTGTMKWDGVDASEKDAGGHLLAEEMGIDRSRPLVVAGSTAPEEHALLVDSIPEGVQLLCAPRRPEWFDEAASVLAGCARRSLGDRGSATGRFLLDTIGELRDAYALADVVVVGRSFGSLHGSDMMEPAALGKPVIVGPSTGDFQQTVDALLEGDGILVSDRDSLGHDLDFLLSDELRRRDLARNARAVVERNQGATDRTLSLIAKALDERGPA
ncbi:MAG: glycosyltransferase N-terminal domain-containing protein [Planctomycetota bacterium]|nr:glycosyltransferase N-terminal domain-containing protein [Planctomycetota bacterium]